MIQRRQPVRAIMKINFQQDKNQGGVRGISKRDPAWRKSRQGEEGRGVLLGGWEDLGEKNYTADRRPHCCTDQRVEGLS